MIIALLLDDDHRIGDTESASQINIYEVDNGLVSLLKRINFTAKEDVLEMLYLDRCEILFLREEDKEFKKKAKKNRIKLKVTGTQDGQQVLDRFAESRKSTVMSQFQQYVRSYELGNEFDIGYFDDDDIGGS